MFSGLLVENFEPFEVENIKCVPQPCVQGFYVPTGWEEELSKRNIAFELRNDLILLEV